MVEQLHCSASFCKLHDFRINAWGLCFRRDALYEHNTAPANDQIHQGRIGQQDLGIEEEVVGIVRREIRQALDRGYSSTPKRQRRQGGIPI